MSKDKLLWWEELLKGRGPRDTELRGVNIMQRRVFFFFWREDYIETQGCYCHDAAELFLPTAFKADLANWSKPLLNDSNDQVYSVVSQISAGRGYVVHKDDEWQGRPIKK